MAAKADYAERLIMWSKRRGMSQMPVYAGSAGDRGWEHST
jgi:hypothetical protein